MHVGLKTKSGLFHRIPPWCYQNWGSLVVLLHPIPPWYYQNWGSHCGPGGQSQCQDFTPRDTPVVGAWSGLGSVSNAGSSDFQCRCSPKENHRRKENRAAVNARRRSTARSSTAGRGPPDDGCDAAIGRERNAFCTESTSATGIRRNCRRGENGNAAAGVIGASTKDTPQHWPDESSPTSQTNPLCCEIGVPPLQGKPGNRTQGDQRGLRGHVAGAI